MLGIERLFFAERNIKWRSRGNPYFAWCVRRYYNRHTMDLNEQHSFVKQRLERTRSGSRDGLRALETALKSIKGDAMERIQDAYSKDVAAQQVNGQAHHG